jgi:hypothetical protein
MATKTKKPSGRSRPTERKSAGSGQSARKPRGRCHAARTRGQQPATDRRDKFTEEELRYVDAYPVHRFVPVSLSPKGQPTIFGAKRTIDIICFRCGTSSTA